MDVGPGYVRILLEFERTNDKSDALPEAATRLLTRRNPADVLGQLAEDLNRAGFLLDRRFGAIPIAGGTRATSVAPEDFDPYQSKLFILRGYVKADPGDIPPEIAGGFVHSDPVVSSYSTCATSAAVGDTESVQAKLDTATLHRNELDGTGVAIAIVDTGIFLPHIEKRLGSAVNFDSNNSWEPPIVTPSGKHRLGHGTMCAYDALIAAPKATLLDMAALLNRPYSDHSAQSEVGAVMRAYAPLVHHWVVEPAIKKQPPPYAALVVNNSWGVLHPSLDLPSGDPARFIDNPNHAFRMQIRALANAGVDIVFAASNCGPECPTAVCLGRKCRMIMGANAYDEVLTLGGCDVQDQRVGYSSKGPSIRNMPPEKPDLTAYTHFLGSQVVRDFVPDSGTSAASAVAAGCIAALRTRISQQTTSPGALFQALKDTALKVAGPRWDPGYGYGIIRPVAAARQLNPNLIQ